MLRTRAPLVVANPFDLHVLGPPQTFALSQDQTLQFESARQILIRQSVRAPKSRTSGCEPLRCSLSHKRILSKTRKGVSLLGLLFLSPVFRGRPTCRCCPSAPVGRRDRLIARLRLVKLFCRDLFHFPRSFSPVICPVFGACPSVVTSRFRPAGSGEAVCNLVGSPRQEPCSIFFEPFLGGAWPRGLTAEQRCEGLFPFSGPVKGPLGPFERI